MPRVVVLSELPTPYRWPLFQRLLARDDVDVRVWFYARTEADRRWELDVQPSARVEFLPGRVWHVRGRRSLFFHFNPSVVRRLRRADVDVVVVPGWSMPTSLLAVVACRLRGIPYVLFSETHARRARPAWLRLAKRVFLRPIVGGARAWLSTGSLSADYLVRHGARREAIRRFANTPDVERLAADVEVARKDRSATRGALETPADAFVTVHVGRLIGAKDVATLLRAQARLEAGHGDAAPWLWVVGDGVEREPLESLALELELRRARFLGALPPERLPAIWAASDLFVLASRHEPWGVVVNEALSAGLPVVVSDQVGAGVDLVQPGRNGERFAVGDDEALARVVGELAAAPRRAAEMGRESARIVAGWGYGPNVESFVAAVRLAVGEST